MRIGIDFDNTLVRCDSLFERAAREWGLLTGDALGGKEAVRDRLRAGGREQTWVELQGYVYGVLLPEAPPFQGAKEFVALCGKQGIPVHVVSHKTRHAARGPAHDLHRSAWQWLKQNGFFDVDGLPRENVFFELGRRQKLRRITDLACTHFIDDLEEIFTEPEFPKGVKKWLFCSGKSHAAGIESFANWDEITDRLREEIRDHAD